MEINCLTLDLVQAIICVENSPFIKTNVFRFSKDVNQLKETNPCYKLNPREAQEENNRNTEVQPNKNKRQQTYLSYS